MHNNLIRGVGEVFVVYNNIYLVVVLGNGKDCGDCYWAKQKTPSCGTSYRKSTAGECLRMFRGGALAVNFAQIKIDKNKEKEEK